jgi:uncharacterized protein DUF4339
MQWYVSQNGKTTGPFDEERLAMLVHWGKISRDAFICDKQLSAWIAIRCTAFAAMLPAVEERSRLGGLVRASATSGADGDSGALDGIGSKQALGLVAFFIILAGLLMAAL